MNIIDIPPHPKDDNGTDWEAVERDFRAGVLSLREIGKKHGINHVAVTRMAKRKKWLKDLTGKVRERVKTALVTLAAPEPQSRARDGNSEDDGVTPEQEAKAATEEEIIAGAAETVVSVVRCHRKDVQRARIASATLMAQLMEAVECRESLRDMIEEETAGDRSPNRRLAMLRAVSIPAHAGTVRDLSVALKNLVALERQAFNIDQSPDDEPPVTAGVEQDGALETMFMKLSAITGKPIDDAPAASPEAPPEAQ